MVPWKLNGWVRAIVPLLAIALLAVGLVGTSPQRSMADDGLNYDLLGRSADPPAVDQSAGLSYNLVAMLSPVASPVSDPPLQPLAQGRFVFSERASAAPSRSRTGPNVQAGSDDLSIWFPGKRLLRGAKNGARRLFGGGC